jgi:membrane fusion protein (multidrug efflux system)
VETLQLVPTRFEEIIQVTGALEAVDDARLSAQSGGTVTSLVPIGTRVGDGDVVARLDDRIVRAALEQANATLSSAEASAELAEDTFRRQEPLYRDSIISALEYENVRSQLNRARAQLSQAKAAVSQAEQELENTYVRAPFAGTVEQRFIEKGEQVSPGMAVARVVGLGKLKVVAGVPERYASDVREGAGVEVRFKAYEMEPRDARVSFAGNVIDPQNRTFRVEIVLSNADGRLKPEMIADLLITRRVLEDQLVIPQTSILHDEQGYSVYIVDRSSGTPAARRVRITTGPSYGGRTVVEDGLESGAEVIVTGQNSVTDGDLLEILSTES